MLRTRRSALIVAAIVLSIPIGSVPSQAEGENGAGRLTRARTAALDAVEQQVAKAFPDIRHITPQELASRLADPAQRIILLDVRSADEFAVSRIAGAVRIAPDERRADAIVQAAGAIEGKFVVAYCAIGLRSSRVLVRVGQMLKERGATGIANVSGGLFRWRNERRPMVDVAGPTTAIHPHNVLWRQLLIEAPELAQN